MAPQAYVIYLGYDKPYPTVGPFPTHESALKWAQRHGLKISEQGFSFRLYALAGPDEVGRTGDE